jgi:hypothetical protein
MMLVTDALPLTADIRDWCCAGDLDNSGYTLTRSTRIRLEGPKSPPPTRDRDRPMLGCRQRGSAGSQHHVWRPTHHGRGAAADRRGVRHPACGAGVGCFAYLHWLRDRRHRDGVACWAVRHAPDSHLGRADDRARSGSCLQRRAVPALCLQPSAAGPDQRRRDVLASHRLCHSVV